MAPNTCENDLTGADFDELDPSTSAHLLARAPGASSSVSLYPYIDQQRSYALNTQQPPLGLPLIVRPHHTRNTISTDESLFSLDDSDPELIIHLAFTELVRIRTLLVSIGRGEEAPRLCRVWTNLVNGIRFEEVDDRKPDQEWELCEADGAVEYPTRISRFQSVSSLTFLFRQPSGSDCSRLFYLGALGEVKHLKKDPTSQLSVGAENATDTTIDQIREQMGGSQTTIR
ncbi:hypothetical protein CROQUDRAFT_60355 [Cronartium quercuum f. sp. fusiforme G11]|uniref:PITH domain-containing protein n=1 Tax=Cronartium quercuum f. sp. fusiforme G11 TaxID=708437 RepID=A0A9P6NN40_9BASI|nr:hypothetical protein CROQUDRAFT_60355 [Cronartium quercuum f. sp. fusiforme G11]